MLAPALRHSLPGTGSCGVPLMKKINRISRILCFTALLAAGYIMVSGKGLTDGSFGPAAYYYTDIPDWQTRFYSSAALTVPNPQHYLWPGILLSVTAAVIFLCLLFRFVQKSEKE